MTLRPSDLPDFGNPPVVETVLSVQFDRLTSVRTAHFGLYWNEFYQRFPRSEERVEIPALVERFPDTQQQNVGIQFEALEAPPSPRFWFTDDAGNEMIQVQRDRFIRNWRKGGQGNSYPRYEHLKEHFQRDFGVFGEFISKRQLGTLRVNQCEITYVNHILAGEGWTSHADVENVFTLWAQPKHLYPGPAQDLMFRARFPILNSGGAPVGRLHATMHCATQQSDGRLMFVLELTARGQLGDDTSFLDLGREVIVRSFKEMTTPAMHRIWQLRNLGINGHLTSNHADK